MPPPSQSLAKTPRSHRAPCHTPTAASSTQLAVSGLPAASSSSVCVKHSPAIFDHCCARRPAGCPGTERWRQVGRGGCRSGQRWALTAAISVITIARVWRDVKGQCIQKAEEHHTSGVCVGVTLSCEKQVEEVLFVFSMCRLRYGRATIIAVCIFENPNDTSLDAPPVQRPSPALAARCPMDHTRRRPIIACTPNAPGRAPRSPGCRARVRPGGPPAARFWVRRPNRVTGGGAAPGIIPGLVVGGRARRAAQDRKSVV